MVEYSNNTFCLGAGDTRIGGDPADVVWFAEISAETYTRLKDKEANRLCFDLIAHIPREQVTSLQTNLPILRREELCVEMRNLSYLNLVDIDLFTWFMEPVVRGPHEFQELLRNLDHIVIIRPTLRGGDWSPLTNFLSRRAAIGNRISSLRLSDHPSMDEDVVESIRRVADVFEDEDGGGSLTATG